MSNLPQPPSDQPGGQRRRPLPQDHGLPAARRAGLAGGLPGPHKRVRRGRLPAAREEEERRGRGRQSAQPRGRAAHAQAQAATAAPAAPEAAVRLSAEGAGGAARGPGRQEEERQEREEEGQEEEVGRHGVSHGGSFSIMG